MDTQLISNNILSESENKDMEIPREGKRTHGRAIVKLTFEIPGKVYYNLET